MKPWRHASLVHAGRPAVLALLVGALLCANVPPALAQAEQPPIVPVPSVPERFTLEGQFVRLAYNNEGYVTLGYRTANASVGEEWMLIEVGMTVRQGTKPYVLKRDAISIKTPDGTVIPLATQQEYAAAELRSLQRMADMVRDSIDYFPGGINRPCRIAFFADVARPTLSYDQVELNDQTGCLGRLYFHVPGGIQYGQHWLNVNFAQSQVQVPFRILTKEEEKVFRKQWKQMKKEHDAAAKQ